MAIPILPLVLEEIGGDNRRAVLTGANLPRTDQAPSFGVAQRTKQEWYIGSPVPTAQILGPEEEPIVFGGVFEDRKTVQGSALVLSALLEDMARAGRPVRLSWGPFVRRCQWGTYRATPTHLQKIAWEIRLESLGPDRGQSLGILSGARALPKVGQVYAAIAESAALVESLRGAPAQLAATLRGAASDVTSLGESITGLRVRRGRERAKIASGLVRQADAIDRSLRIAYDGVHAIDPDAETTGTAFSRAFGVRADVRRASVAIVAAQRELGTVRRRLDRISGATQTAELYQVHDGEVLQRIALRRLGDHARAAEIAAANGLITWGLAGGTHLELRSPSVDRTASA